MACKSKGTGGGGCCCGGCYSPPTDSRPIGTGIQPVQLFCCKCIPKYLCASLSGEAYEGSVTRLERFCGVDYGGESPYTGDAIIFAGTLNYGGQQYAIAVRLKIEDELCHLTWEIPDLELSGQKLIDHDEQSTDPLCRVGMKTEVCVNFGGEWETEGYTLALDAPATLDIAELIACAGCRCMCDCLCMSIYSRGNDGTITLVGSNTIVCSTISETVLENCDASRTEIVRSAGWSVEGWSVSLQGGYDSPASEYTVLSGTDNEPDCEIYRVLRFGDAQEHQISGPDPSVYYEFKTEELPLSIRWSGRSTDEDSTTTLALWNWNAAAWDVVGTRTGREVGEPQNHVFKTGIDADYIDLVNGLHEVRFRVSSDGDELYTDLCRIKTAKCCQLELTPPYGIVPTSTIEKLNLADEGNCPSPFKFWSFTDEDETEWYVSISCSWCGGNCGTVSTDCCPRPISRTLFAEVLIDCPTCTQPFTVPLIDSTGAGIWEGAGTHCGEEFRMTLSCGGNGWNVVSSGAGACSFTGDAVAVDCEPLNIEFAGEFAGGIGCCGISGGAVTTAPITITVIE